MVLPLGGASGGVRRLEGDADAGASALRGGEGESFRAWDHINHYVRHRFPFREYDPEFAANVHLQKRWEGSLINEISNICEDVDAVVMIERNLNY